VFDLRYHVASLAAVFLALIIGILVGVGISGKGFVSDSERALLNDKIDRLQSAVNQNQKRVTDLTRAQRSAQAFVQDAYPALMNGRLSSSKVALVFAGPIDRHVRSLVEQTLGDAGAEPPLRIWALKLPIDLPRFRRTLAKRPALAALATQRRVGDLGRRLGSELVVGGDTPLWNALAPDLVEEKEGNDRPPADAVVVARSVAPQSGVTARFLAGFYQGLRAPGSPAVGVEVLRPGTSAVEAFARQQLSTVDDLDTQSGRLALALLLAGADSGNYGVKKNAHDGVLPPIPVG
jgi:Copper transport outer membrane protein, MctB